MIHELCTVAIRKIKPSFKNTLNLQTMARSKNPLMHLVSGMFGKQIIFKTYYDKTVISKMPDMSRRKLSDKQKDWNWRMRLANAYAKHVYNKKEERMKERVRLCLPPHKSLFHALVKEHLDKHKDIPLIDVR
jgi:hypothetical protein